MFLCQSSIQFRHAAEMPWATSLATSREARPHQGSLRHGFCHGKPTMWKSNPTRNDKTCIYLRRFDAEEVLWDFEFLGSHIVLR